MNRADFVRTTVRRCKRCPLFEMGHGPVPFRGPVPARYAIMGEAPGRTEDLEGLPFVGPSGQLLTECMTAVGLDVAEALIFNTVSCWPQGTPQDEHIEACRPLVKLQLGLTASNKVLVLGGTALSWWFPTWKIHDARGELYGPLNGYLIFPVWHPAYVLRKTYLKKSWQADLHRFVEMLERP